MGIIDVKAFGVLVKELERACKTFSSEKTLIDETRKLQKHLRETPAQEQPPEPIEALRTSWVEFLARAEAAMREDEQGARPVTGRMIGLSTLSSVQIAARRKRLSKAFDDAIEACARGRRPPRSG